MTRSPSRAPRWFWCGAGGCSIAARRSWTSTTSGGSARRPSIGRLSQKAKDVIIGQVVNITASIEEGTESDTRARDGDVARPTLMDGQGSPRDGVQADFDRPRSFLGEVMAGHLRGRSAPRPDRPPLTRRGDRGASPRRRPSAGRAPNRPWPLPDSDPSGPRAVASTAATVAGLPAEQWSPRLRGATGLKSSTGLSILSPTVVVEVSTVDAWMRQEMTGGVVRNRPTAGTSATSVAMGVGHGAPGAGGAIAAGPVLLREVGFSGASSTRHGSAGAPRLVGCGWRPGRLAARLCQSMKERVGRGGGAKARDRRVA
ncbi:unnamed protein product [Prorocentrum cordatum]|uniref:Uncharacterized protein n=1 Tax=Prorocentrum cordatum TaxID=2364126 RepID=A0ABN9QL28_9DINO|nr:unnamed protein product [Polarella glacialis]